MTIVVIDLCFLFSVWIIVCMSFERYFAVSHPLRASQMCTTKRAKWVRVVVFSIFANLEQSTLRLLRFTSIMERINFLYEI